MNFIEKLTNFLSSIALISLLMGFEQANASCPAEEALKKPLQEACNMNIVHLWLIEESPNDEAIYKDFSFASDNQTRLLAYIGNDLVKLAGGKDRGFDGETGEFPKLICEFISKCTEELTQQGKIATQFNTITEIKMARNEILQCTSTDFKKFITEKYPTEAPEAIALGFPNVSYCKQSITLEISPSPFLD